MSNLIILYLLKRGKSNKFWSHILNKLKKLESNNNFNECTYLISYLISHIEYVIYLYYITLNVKLITITYNTCKTFYKNSIFLLYSQISKKVFITFLDQFIH